LGRPFRLYGLLPLIGNLLLELLPFLSPALFLFFSIRGREFVLEFLQVITTFSFCIERHPCLLPMFPRV